MTSLSSSSGRPSRFGLASLHFGLRGSLLMAFGVIAARTILISASGNLLLNRLGHMMAALNDREIPSLGASLELSALSQALAAKGPALLNSATEESRQENMKALETTEAAITAKLNELRTLDADPTVVSALAETVRMTKDTVSGLASAAKERLDAVSLAEKQYGNLLKAQAAFSTAADAALDDARNTYSTVLSLGITDNNAVAKASRAVEQLNALVSSTNVLVVNMASAFAAKSSDVIDGLQTSYKHTADATRTTMASLADEPGTEAVRAATATLLAMGSGKTGVFQVRQKELDALDYGRLILEETNKLNRGLDVSIDQLVGNVRTETAAATQRARGMILTGSLVMAALGAMTIIGAILFVWLYVGRNILRRIGNLQHAMRQLSDGNLDTAIDGSDRRDEVGAMARALVVFRDNMARARSLDTERDDERKQKIQRTERIEARIRGFENTVHTALRGLIQAADSMQATAQVMAGSATRSSELASAVAAAAEQTSVNVQTISSGTEELSSSIAEIGRQVTTSAEVARKAVADADATDGNVQGLAENANRITVVVDLIQSIASQTNLLALNATIEAARAGEAGRGFAVVASEVKSLADQTAKATEEIRAQIAGMQHSTSTTVTAIRHIGETITQINEVTAAIAAAVEEQGAATREIARNIQHASGGTSDVSRNIVGVSEASSEAGTAADQVLTASGILRREADQLRAEIDEFLTGIRAA